MRWRRFVAVGDSFTEGLDDPSPDGLGYRGWADLVAARLAVEATRPAVVDGSPATGPTDVRFEYANLAVRGRLFDAIVDQQVPSALAMRPDLISFAGGGNDVLRRNINPVEIAARFDRVIGELRATGADVIIFRWADVTTRLPGRRMILPRMRILNQAVDDVTQRRGAIQVDLWDDLEFHNPVLWSEDRLHMAPAGHRRVAAHVLTALGVDPEASWWDPPRPVPRQGWLVARTGDVRWARRHLAPWLTRRLTGRSSGDTIIAKRPALSPVDVD
jgi:lysophospholipase L1-like esterase